MKNIVHRIISPEAPPQYILADELGELSLIKSDAELVKIEGKIQNYKLDSMHLGTAERLGNYGYLLFIPMGHCNSIESITSIIPMAFWHIRKMQGMSNQSIILQYIRVNLTDNI